MVDCVIIGGGAAGLAAAVFFIREAERRGRTPRLLVLEKGPRVGKKLLATGNGTCNLTNVGATKEHYHGAAGLAGALLDRFTPEDAIRFFESIGVDCVVRPDKKVYPASLQAGSVLDSLRLEAEAGGARILCGEKAVALQRRKNGWQVQTDRAAYDTRLVLAAVGGAAAPSLGGSAEGYRLLTDLGCEKTALFPSIVQLRTDTAFVRAVKGIRVDAKVTLRLDGKAVGQQTGETLFTDYGLSGPAVMQISRPAADWERQKKGKLTVTLDLLPAWTEERLYRRIAERRQLRGRTLEDTLAGLFHKRVGQTLFRAADIGPLTRPGDSLTDGECRRVAHIAKNWELPVTGTQGFGGAQVTAGGIKAGEADSRTLELKRLPGVYVAGEVLDVDGDCGGYNLQFAWSSAYGAARAMAAALFDKEKKG